MQIWVKGATAASHALCCVLKKAGNLKRASIKGLVTDWIVHRDAQSTSAILFHFFSKLGEKLYANRVRLNNQIKERN